MYQDNPVHLSNLKSFEMDRSLPVELLMTPIPDKTYKKLVDSKDSPLRKRLESQAPDLLAETSGSRDILKAYVKCTCVFYM